MQTKIKTIDEIQEILREKRKQGIHIVQCHGVFDLVHPGHVRHFQEARKQGDCLVVTVTSDRYVNKGPGRPVFNEGLRSETLAALAVVDYVVINDTPDAVDCIKQIRPDVYVKGVEYADSGADVTGKITVEKEAVESGGGRIYFTDDIVFSSSSLLNHFFSHTSEEVTSFIKQLKTRTSIEEIQEVVTKLSQLNVLIVGDAIIDEYQYAVPLGQSGKGLHMAVRNLDSEVFLGGSLIVANHAAQFAGGVTLMTALGKECPYRSFIQKTLDPKIKSEFVFSNTKSTLIKKRYVWRDGQALTKLFETYSSNDVLLQGEETDRVLSFIEKHAANFDMVLVCDFGNGFTNPRMTKALSMVPTFLAVNTQTNSGNRGFNVVTHYDRADFVSLNEPELRLAAHDRYSSVDELMVRIGKKLGCKAFSSTRGVLGVSCLDLLENRVIQVPALVTTAVDRVGAGDSYFVLASLALAVGASLEVASLLGSVAAALDVQIVGNREPVKKVPFCKYLTRLLK